MVGVIQASAALSPICFIILIDRISRRSCGASGGFGGLSMSSVLFADYAVLLTSLTDDLLLASSVKCWG